MLSEQGWAGGLSCTQMKLEGCSSSAGTNFLRKRSWKHVQLFLCFSRGAVGEVVVMFAASLSSKLLLDSAAGAPAGPCCSSEVVSLLLVWRGFFLFARGKFSCWFKEEE